MHASLIEKDSRAEVNLIRDDQDMEKDNSGTDLVERERECERERERERERETSDSLLLKDSRTKATTGSCVSSLYPLKDFEDSGNESGFFVFPDLSVRMEGTYRLKFCLYEMTGTQVHFCASIVSAPLVVYSAKKFPGMEESTTLSQFFAEQGLKIRIRKEVRPKKRARAGYAREVTFETPKQAKDYNDPSESTEDDESRATEHTSKRIAIPNDAHWRDAQTSPGAIPEILGTSLLGATQVSISGATRTSTGKTRIQMYKMLQTSLRYPRMKENTEDHTRPIVILERVQTRDQSILSTTLTHMIGQVQTMILITVLQHPILAVMDVHSMIARVVNDTIEHRDRIQQTSDGLHTTCTQATITFTTHRLEATQTPIYDGLTQDTRPIHLLGALFRTRTYHQNSLPEAWFLIHTHPTFVLFMARTSRILLHLILRLAGELQEGRVSILAFRIQNHTRHPIKT
ncbi:hypothetical protein BGZ92_005078 [Podila epicladia]|nr:hypothetical protein BGZ92_005078 [Podila epicladia]